MYKIGKRVCPFAFSQIWVGRVGDRTREESDYCQHRWRGRKARTVTMLPGERAWPQPLQMLFGQNVIKSPEGVPSVLTVVMDGLFHHESTEWPLVLTAPQRHL